MKQVELSFAPHMPPTAHEQTFVKVNALCDVGVEPLVSALNEIEGVITTESCQEQELGRACVWFRYGWGWSDIAEFANELAKALGTQEPYRDYEISLKWYGTNDQPQAELIVNSSDVTGHSLTVRQLAATMSDHKNAYPDDKKRTRLRS